jgi:RhtB (resistance to homoserine/threonine) family protein
MLAILIAYTLAATLLTITPGADTLLVIRYAGSAGKKSGFAAAAGVCLGTLVWGAIVAVGVAALIVASPFLFTLLKWAGAAYLVWLGIQLFRSKPASGEQTPAARATNPFASGLLTNLLNPKVGVFYLAFLPQFIPPGVAQAPFILLLAAIHSLLGLIWFAVLIAGTDRLADRLRNSRISDLLAKVAGLLFIGFGARLLLTSR